jgi:hypothetical protein
MTTPRRRVLWHHVVLALLVVLFAGPALRNGFVIDDTRMIVDGHVIHQTGRALEAFRHPTMWVSDEGTGRATRAAGLQTYRPVSLLTFFADAAVWGRNPVGYHLTSLLLHIVCVLLVRALCARAMGADASEWSPTIAAAWFALSPLLAEAYVWVNGRSDPLALAFGLGGWLAWLRARDGGRASIRHLVPPAMLWFAGLLSKEALVFALPAFVVWPGLTRRDRVHVASAVLGAVAMYLLLRRSALGGLSSHEDSRQLVRAVTRLGLLWLDGLASLLVPNRVYLRIMADEYDSLGVGVAIAAWCVVAGIAATVVAKRASLQWLPWGLTFHAASLAPVALIATLPWAGFGRYLYLPAAGLAVPVASFVEIARRKLADAPIRTRRLARAGMVVYLAALGARLVVWTLAWHDERELYEQAIADAPDRAGGYAWLGDYLLEHGRPAEALPVLLKANARWSGDRRVLEDAARAATLLGDRETAWRVAQAGISRFQPAGPFYLVAAWARRDEPAVAAGLLARCLGEGEEAAPCVTAARALVSGPRAREFADAFARWCDAHPADPAVARVRVLTSPAAPAPAGPQRAGAPSPP